MVGEVVVVSRLEVVVVDVVAVIFEMEEAGAALDEVAATVVARRPIVVEDDISSVEGAKLLGIVGPASDTVAFGASSISVVGALGCAEVTGVDIASSWPGLDVIALS